MHLQGFVFPITRSDTYFQLGRLVVGSDLPYRMAVHPREGGLICALPNSCK